MSRQSCDASASAVVLLVMAKDPLRTQTSGAGSPWAATLERKEIVSARKSVTTLPHEICLNLAPSSNLKICFVLGNESTSADSPCTTAVRAGSSAMREEQQGVSFLLLLYSTIVMRSIQHRHLVWASHAAAMSTGPLSHFPPHPHHTRPGHQRHCQRHLPGHWLLAARGPG